LIPVLDDVLTPFFTTPVVKFAFFGLGLVAFPRFLRAITVEKAVPLTIGPLKLRECFVFSPAEDCNDALGADKWPPDCSGLRLGVAKFDRVAREATVLDKESPPWLLNFRCASFVLLRLFTVDDFVVDVDAQESELGELSGGCNE
jgi:hypothetical protein